MIRYFVLALIALALAISLALPTVVSEDQEEVRLRTAYFQALIRLENARQADAEPATVARLQADYNRLQTAYMRHLRAQ